jgi:cytochrome c-type protein NapB
MKTTLLTPRPGLTPAPTPTRAPARRPVRKSALTALTLTRTALTAGGAVRAAEYISERGIAIEAPSPEPEKRRVEVVPGGFERAWEQQPPMIPHAIDKYSIDLRQNGCLKCHSVAAAEKEHAKPTPESHFLDRDGNKQDHLAGLRYFCTQCHAPQLSGAPLVENTFEGAH